MDCESDDGNVRQFAGGATRDTAEGKYDYSGFLSPIALERYAQYMHAHRKQSDGKLRASDNWKHGMDYPIYLSSGWRHLKDLWTLHCGWKVYDRKDNHEITKEEACCALLFNIWGYLHELMKSQRERIEGA